MMLIAMNTSIAEINGKGKSTKTLLKSIRENANAPSEAISHDIFDVPPLAILSDVLTKTAVEGRPHINPDQILARAFQRTSLFLLNGTLVFF